jgi:hypothetical protein
MLTEDLIEEIKQIKHNNPYLVVNKNGVPLSNLAYSHSFKKNLNHVNKMIEL